MSYAEFRFSSYFPRKVARMKKKYANIQPKWKSVKIECQKSDQENKRYLISKICNKIRITFRKYLVNHLF